MKTLALVLSVLLGVFMIFAGVQHFMNPATFLPFVPAFLPFRPAFVPLSGIVEILLGAAALVPALRSRAAWGIMCLMIVFLPLHVWDVFREQPAIGSHQAALMRLPFQFVFILWAGVVGKYSATKR